ncbi:MAG: protein-L-isoaspartate O-methyltransferase [Gammaproteobacteria bacterium]|nr:protein-L-isoaspartate O-methyltransferase [Gammaproteobacteria bacterium]
MNTEFAREQMVRQQVRTWDVFDARILDVLRNVPREQFVPGDYLPLAFADTEIPIGHGEYMLTPTLEGRLLQSLDISAHDRALEVGTGTGFLTACLGRLASSVTSIDIHESFLANASTNLEDSGITNVSLHAMDATQTLPDERFDVIAVTGSIERFDPRYVDRLTPGGRLFIVVGGAPSMDARLVTRRADKDWSSDSLFETRLKPLVNGALPPQFYF